MCERFGVVALLIGLMSGPVHAIGDDSWDWYTGMTPYEQCMDYLNGDPFIEKVIAEDLSHCEEIWGEPTRWLIR
jgi:hypothetical protein